MMIPRTGLAHMYTKIYKIPFYEFTAAFQICAHVGPYQLWDSLQVCLSGPFLHGSATGSPVQIKRPGSCVLSLT